MTTVCRETFKFWQYCEYLSHSKGNGTGYWYASIRGEKANGILEVFERKCPKEGFTIGLEELANMLQ